MTMFKENQTQVFEVNYQSQSLRDVTPSAAPNPLLEFFMNEGRSFDEAHQLYRRIKNHDPIKDIQLGLRKTALGEAIKNASGHVDLLEAFVLSPDAGNLLRDGVRFLSMLSYAELPSTFAQFASVQASDHQQEEWLRDGIMGVLPRYKSGEPIPMLRSGFEGGALIKNYPYAGIIEVTGDDIRFDRLGKVRQAAQELGRSGRMTEEATVYADITTTANYVRNSTTNDNDVGANTQTLTFSGVAFETALTIIATAKDRKSGAYLGLNADTFLVHPRMAFPVKQLLFSDQIWRVGGNTTNEVRGGGTNNPYLGLISKLVVSPWFTASTTAHYAWALTDSTRQSYVLQMVEPFSVISDAMAATSEAWMARNSLRWQALGYFGTGFIDDRAWFYSDSTTVPAIS